MNVKYQLWLHKRLH